MRLQHSLCFPCLIWKVSRSVLPSQTFSGKDESLQTYPLSSMGYIRWLKRLFILLRCKWDNLDSDGMALQPQKHLIWYFVPSYSRTEEQRHCALLLLPLESLFWKILQKKLSDCWALVSSSPLRWFCTLPALLEKLLIPRVWSYFPPRYRCATVENLEKGVGERAGYLGTEWESGMK